MPPPSALSPAHLGAVALAAVGAVLFGLASVRQHGAVREAGSATRLTLSGHLRSALRLVRDRAWLIGAGQAGLGGALHIVALALAPITLVQPIGVLAVPVTVVATAAREGRAPRRAPVLGAALSVAGIAALTVVLLGPASHDPVLPGWLALAVTAAAILTAGFVLTLTGGRGRPLVRCVSLATTAAVLFGLNSILIRTIGAAVTTGDVSHRPALVITAAVGLAAALPLGVWAMQRAYVSGSSQVVICCLTLMDPLTAVVGGRLLLHDGAAITGRGLVEVVVCALVAAGGVLLLSAGYPVDDANPDPDPAAPPRSGAGLG